MKKLKKQLAVVLIAVMVLSQAIIAFAGTTKSGLSKNEDGQWIYQDNKDMVINELVQLELTNKSQFYYFKEDGTMAIDELFERKDMIGDSSEDGEDGSCYSYAFPDGHIAMNCWVCLNDEGNVSFNGDWRYFDKEGVMLANSSWPKTISGKAYAFDSDGKMLTRQFAEFEDDYGQTTRRYFEYYGQSAKNKWLPIDGYWYCFNEGGSINVATSSNAEYVFDEDGALVSDNAPYCMVDSIDLIGEIERKAEINKMETVTFKVNLATDSNAQVKELTEDHDFWLEEDSDFTVLGGYERKNMKLNKDGTFSASYKLNYPGEIHVTAVVDGVKSADSVTIKADWGSNSDTKKAERIEALLKSPGDNVAEAVDMMHELLGEMENKDSLIRGWLSNGNFIEKLENDYLIAKRIDKTEEITDAASALLVSGEAKVIGVGLNAEEGSTIKFQVDVGEPLNLDTDYSKQVAFDLSCGELTEFGIPVIVNMPLPKGISTDGLTLYHEHNGTIVQLDFKVSGNMASFVTDGMSTFAFAGQAVSSDGNDGDGGNGDSDSSSDDEGSSSRHTVSQTIPETPGYWKKIENGQWQFIDMTGQPYTNIWIYVKGNWYWINSTGIMVEGWQDIAGKRYYLTPGVGAMVSGWLHSAENWYYMDVSGVMQTGWININDKWYYLKEDGVMLTDATTPDGYRVDVNGTRQ